MKNTLLILLAIFFALSIMFISFTGCDDPSGNGDDDDDTEEEPPPNSFQIRFRNDNNDTDMAIGTTPDNLAAFHIFEAPGISEYFWVTAGNYTVYLSVDNGTNWELSGYTDPIDNMYYSSFTFKTGKKYEYSNFNVIAEMP
jgi:hypothetical protein